MDKLIRVILSLDPSGFAAGIITANSAVELLKTGIELLRKAFDFVKGAIEEASNMERLNFQLNTLTGNAQVTADIIKHLGDEALQYGFKVDDVLPAVNQLALALKSVDGSVNPDKLARYSDVVLELSKITGQSVDTIGDAVRRAVESGDLQALIRGVGINVKDMAGLSKEAQDIIARMGQAGAEQLGQVTKVGGGTKVTSEEVLKVLEEVTNKLGGGKKVLEDYGNTFNGQIGKLQELWQSFAETFGTEFEQAILPKLKEFVQYLIDHKDEIMNFAKTMADFTAKGVIAMVDALERVDWKTIGDVMKMFGQGEGSPVDAGASAAQSVKAAIGMGPNQSLAQTQAGQDIFKWLNQTAANLHITVDMDPNGQWKAHVDNAANKAVGNVVDQATRSSGGNPNTAAHGRN